jgi:hypothetical protein
MDVGHYSDVLHICSPPKSPDRLSHLALEWFNQPGM